MKLFDIHELGKKDKVKLQTEMHAVDLFFP